jgi:hypothetical protein
VKLLERLGAQPWALPLARVGFWVTLLGVFAAAEVPSKHPPDLFGWDKANHFAAFYALSVLGAGAFPRLSLLALGAWLSAFGALIELVQALPFIHRDADVVDWLTDTAAVAAALCPLLLARWREICRLQRR